MNFDFTDEQQEIKRTARELLARRSPLVRVRQAAESRTYDETLWQELVELGWPGIAVSEEYDGQGLGIVGLAIVLEELGYAVAATPLLPTALAALAIERTGSEEQRERWVRALISGEARGGFGPPELVADGDEADVSVVLGPDGAELVQSSGVTVTTVDPTRRFARFTDSGEPLEGSGELVRDLAAVALSAELVGVCQRALDMTLEYVKQRKQFGVPVSSFQAVSHRCAAMLFGTESARSAAYNAAWVADAEPERLPEAAALALAAAAEAARDVTASAIQAHGGVGFTWEADVHWLFKRAQVDSLILGGPGAHRKRLARLVAAAPAASR
jgi:alkylation response protein AidB-like acyl-CoA dehydrogenase